MITEATRNGLAASQIARRHFAASTLAALKQRGIRIVGMQAADPSGASAGYRVDDNGTGRVWDYLQIIAAARGDHV